MHKTNHMAKHITTGEKVMDALEYFFNSSFPQIVPAGIASHTLSRAWLNGLLQIGNDYCRLLCDMAMEKDHRDMTWLRSAIGRIEKRTSNWLKKKNLSQEHQISQTISRTLEWNCSEFVFELWNGSELVSFSRHLHQSIAKRFSPVMNSAIINEKTVVTISDDFSHLLGMKHIQKAELQMEYLKNLVEMMIVYMYCPHLLSEWIRTGRMDASVDVSGIIFDKDFYTTDLKAMARAFQLYGQEAVCEYLDMELRRKTSPEIVDNMLNQWKKQMHEMIHSETASSESIVFIALHHTAEEEPKQVVVVKDILLYRSEFFNTMIGSGMKETNQEVIGLECSNTVLTALFEFVYTGSFQDETCAPELMVYCDMIGFRYLLNTCAHIIKKNIQTIEDALSMYNFSKSVEYIPAVIPLKLYCAAYYRRGIKSQLDDAIIPEEMKDEPIEDYI